MECGTSDVKDFVWTQANHSLCISSEAIASIWLDEVEAKQILVCTLCGQIRDS